jgi:replicative DNA helicase
MAVEKISEDTHRIPPQAGDVEMSVLGAMMLEESAVLRGIDILKEDFFYNNVNKIIFSVITKLFSDDKAVDMITVEEELRKKKLLEKVGGPPYLTECLGKVTSVGNIEYHCRIIKEKYILRSLITRANAIAEEAYLAQDDADEILDSAEQKILDIAGDRLKKGFDDINKVLHETFHIIEDFHKHKSGYTGIPSGYTALDELTNGFQKADLIIIAGRPSMGKTAFALNVARNAAVDHNIPVGFFSLEMSNHQLAMRLLCAESRIDANNLRKGRIKDEEWANLSLFVGRLAEAPIFIDDSASLTILELRAKARRLKAEKNIGMLVVDYMQLIQGPSKIENRQQEISFISRSLKALAKELSIPVIALSQLSRAPVTRGGDKRPMLSDLRESGAIEQDADVVLFIHRPEFFGVSVDDEGNSVEGIGEVIVGKQRNGPSGDTIKLAFIKKYAKFETLSFDEVIPVAEEEPF